MFRPGVCEVKTAIITNRDIEFFPCDKMVLTFKKMPGICGITYGTMT